VSVASGGPSGWQAKQHDGVVVHHYHTLIMRRGADVEEMRRHLPSEPVARRTPTSSTHACSCWTDLSRSSSVKIASRMGRETPVPSLPGPCTKSIPRLTACDTSPAGGRQQKRPPPVSPRRSGRPSFPLTTLRGWSVPAGLAMPDIPVRVCLSCTSLTVPCRRRRRGTSWRELVGASPGAPRAFSVGSAMATALLSQPITPTKHKPTSPPTRAAVVA
jgi:hypothetical protein